jgi:hypothetical protein
MRLGVYARGRGGRSLDELHRRRATILRAEPTPVRRDPLARRSDVDRELFFPMG